MGKPLAPFLRLSHKWPQRVENRSSIIFGYHIDSINDLRELKLCIGD